MLLTTRGNSLDALHFDTLDASVNIRMRRSVATSSFPVAARFRNTTTKKLRLSGNQAVFLRASPDSTSLSLGPQSDDEPQACFKMHYFILPVSGNVVVIQANDGRYITKNTANSEGVTLMTGDAPQQTSTTDNRFFRVYTEQGGHSIYLEHLHSGKHLSASTSGVSLIPATDDRPESTSFKQYNCTHT